MLTSCTVDVHLLPRALQRLDLVCNKLHRPFQPHAQVEGVKVPDGMPVVRHISPRHAALSNWRQVQVKEGHVCVLLQVHYGPNSLLVR